MPPSITPSTPHSLVGPGLPLAIGASSPPDSGLSQYAVSVYAPGSGVSPFYAERFNALSGNVTVYLMAQQGSGSTQRILDAAVTDDNVTVIVQAMTSSGATISSSSITATWDAQSGIGFQQMLLGQHTSALTPAQANQLQQAATQTNQILGLDPSYANDTIATVQLVVGNVLDGITSTFGAGVDAVQRTIGQIFSGHTMDMLVASTDIGTACNPDVLTSTLPIGGSVYGLQIQATTVPDWIAFVSGPEDYSETVLYWLELIRSGNTVVRKGIHTVTYLEYPLPGIPTFPIGLELPLDPGNYELRITPAVGVCVAAQVLGFP